MKKYLIIFLLLPSMGLQAQSDRINDPNQTNWLQTFLSIKLHSKWSAQGEFQWRRTNGLCAAQQDLLRTGLTYQVNDQMQVHAGYALALTHPYGEYPIAANGSFPEHRVYEQLVLRQPVKKWTFTHRFRIEQRWLRRTINSGDQSSFDWYFLHRFRYQFRTQYSFFSRQQKQFYGAAADEIFIGAGKNLGSNIFDQNRIFFLLGYRFNKNIALEGGYFNQTLQQGRRVNNQAVIQRNNGVVLATLVQL